ncbi:MAG: phosphoribosylaminoimidazole carboxylase [Elusimicrobia bacterium]|nr:phosphoribosylaminoimidazole carboxylase [Elusimicrobiota bacterium]
MNEPALEPPKPPFFQRASGAAILAVDWLCFGLEWELGPLSMAAMSVAAFVVTYAVVWKVQTRLGGDGARRAHGKAFLGALAAGVPFPVTGTVVGGLILALSGLRPPRLRR